MLELVAIQMVSVIHYGLVNSSGTDCKNGDLQLVGGDNNREGRIEICVYCHFVAKVCEHAQK